jgi:hypothetical protein
MIFGYRIVGSAKGFAFDMHQNRHSDLWPHGR